MKQDQNAKFIETFQQDLKSTLLEHPEIETVNHIKGLPKHILDKILLHNPLSIFIASEFGGRGDKAVDCLSMLEAASYESIAVGLMMGISGSLFLEPITKYGQDEAKQHVLKSFLDKPCLGGLMITEPDYGTDALAMRTSFTESQKGYSLKGSKHWGGLTGLADFWIVTAREHKIDGKLARDINLFIVEKDQPGQKIDVEEYYHKLGLFLIPYGLNKVNARVPENSRLIPQTSGVKLMMDLLHRSRLRLSGLGMGFIKRILVEALTHCKQRYVGGKNLLGYDQVQHRISQLQAWYTINSAMCHYAAGTSGINKNLSSLGLQANATKAVLTDMMQNAAQSLLQLNGAMGYRRDSFAGRAVADSRPFQIFEGSNDVMYSQIADKIIKEMGKKKESNLYAFLSQFALTEKITPYYKQILNFRLDNVMLQRTRIVLGKIIAALITTEFTFGLAEAGFRQDLIDNAIKVVEKNLSELVSSFTHIDSIIAIEDYQEGSNWKTNFSHLGG